MADEKNTTLTRREFAAGAAALAVSATIPAAAQQATQPPKPPSQEPALAPASQAEAGRAYQAIVASYGERFTEEQKKDLQHMVELQQKLLDTLRSYEINNSDQPATVLRLVSGESR